MQMKVMKNLELEKDEKINFVVEMDEFKKTMEEFTSKKQSKKKEKTIVLSLKNLEKFEKKENQVDLTQDTKEAEKPIAQIQEKCMENFSDAGSSGRSNSERDDLSEPDTMGTSEYSDYQSCSESTFKTESSAKHSIISFLTLHSKAYG
jgi:uncharacterized linocin/CFP29 family protein